MVNMIVIMVVLAACIFSAVAAGVGYYYYAYSSQGVDTTSTPPPKTAPPPATPSGSGSTTTPPSTSTTPPVVPPVAPATTPSAPAALEWADYDNRDLAGYDLGAGVVVTDYAACKASCEADPACYNVAYGKSTKTCWKKAPGSAPVSYSFKTTDGKMKTLPGKVDYAGYDLPGMPLNGKSAAECAASCLSNTDCHWSSKVDDGRCFLHGLAPNNDRTFGFRMKGLTLS